MTTTYDTELNTQTIAASAVSEPTESLYACYDDPDTYTISEAWAGSPMGEPDDNISDSLETIEVVDDPKPRTNRATLAAALAAGIIGGATLGAVLFGYSDPAQPTFVVPWGAVKTSPSQAEVVPPGSQRAQSKPVATVAPAPTPAEQAPAKPIAPEQKTNQEFVAAPVDPGIPPVSAPPVIVDVFIPPLQPLGNDKPEPSPAPDPPTFDPPNIDVVQVPEAATTRHRRFPGPDHPGGTTARDLQQGATGSAGQAEYAEAEYGRPSDPQPALGSDQPLWGAMS